MIDDFSNQVKWITHQIPNPPRNHVPKFRAQLRVPEQEAHSPHSGCFVDAGKWCRDWEEVPRINKPFTHIAERRVFIAPLIVRPSS